ncbi:hypothetical protein OOT46_04085 [Aquabacterium sp. A7-Y]|uniref:hypothetical protein n=1 Tax=Aquabacterium sp. A7-Y TaxID=1349605 RepID=UPI00223CFD10|nr:hypothetical protein [Aquabacterium sp. A7-Y]MCW7537030.1 hypothetical protein [Aquabacterium sp. A7-Y]
MSNIDLNRPPPNHKFSVAIDREETNDERKVRLFKDVALFLVAIAFVLRIAWLCYSTLTSPTWAPEEKKWAMSVISAAAGGIIGYLVRR